MSEFDDYLRRAYTDAEKKLADLLPPGYTVHVDDTPLNVHKVAGYMEIPDELLMGYGLIPDTRHRCTSPGGGGCGGVGRSGASVPVAVSVAGSPGWT